MGNAPHGNLPLNPIGSAYPTESGYTTAETLLIQRAIKRAIFDAAPQEYDALKLVFAKDIEDVPLDEFTFLEKTFGRKALTTNDTEVAVAAVAGSEVTYTVTMAAGSTDYVAPDDIITFPDNTKGIVRSKSGNNLVIASMTSQGLPAVAPGDVWSIHSTIYGDGDNAFSHYDRMEFVERYNYVQFFLRAQRWDRIEMQKHKNAGTTNYMEMDKAEKMTQLRTDLFVSYFNGTRGEFMTSRGIAAKAMGGIFPTMTAAGAMSGNPTLAGLKAQFETLAFKTNHKKAGSTRFIYGTDETLYEVCKVFKHDGIRYAPNDTVANMNLTEYKIGQMRFVPVSCELFRERACFPASWQRKLLILDQESITPIKMAGIPAVDSGETLDKGKNGTREAFKDFFVEANLSMRFNNPLGSFTLDIQ